MEQVEGIRSTVADIFLTLPLLLIGFIFFLGTMTSNIGLLYLFLGHLLIVPALSFAANDLGTAWFEDKKFSLTHMAKWLYSVGMILGIQSTALGGGDKFWLYVLGLIPFIGQFLMYQQGNDKPVLFFFNILGWFMNPNRAESNDSCAMVPGAEKVGSTPSAWLVHLTFFFGFLYANVSAIMMEPAPRLDVSTPDFEKRQEALDIRVSNRMSLTTSIVGISTFVFIALLVFRYSKTACEGGFLYSLVPLIIIGLTGSAWFTVIYTRCGVRPADILGIVQGMVSPDMIDRPIVCVGAAEPGS
jgi:hypothetical protein